MAGNRIPIKVKASARLAPETIRVTYMDDVRGDVTVCMIPRSQRVQYQNAADGKTKTQDGINKPLLLWILRITQEQFSHHRIPSTDLTKLTSGDLRHILGINIEEILDKPFII